MTLPDGSYVIYIYDAFHLKKIQRFTNQRELSYECECQYDLRGKLLTSVSPAGTISYAYDLLGRTIKIQTPNWEICQEQFDPVGNLLNNTQKDPTGTLNGTFTYDRFNHLTLEQNHETNRYLYDSFGEYY